MSEHTDTTAATALTFEELVDSLTGFDEIAIEKFFDGFDIYSEGESRSIRALRAAAFIHRRREGDNDREAFQFAQNLPFKALIDYFAEAVEELDPDAPETESGKDAEQLG